MSYLFVAQLSQNHGHWNGPVGSGRTDDLPYGSDSQATLSLLLSDAPTLLVDNPLYDSTSRCALCSVPMSG